MDDNLLRELEAAPSGKEVREGVPCVPGRMVGSTWLVAARVLSHVVGCSRSQGATRVTADAHDLAIVPHQ